MILFGPVTCICVVCWCYSSLYIIIDIRHIIYIHILTVYDCICICICMIDICLFVHASSSKWSTSFCCFARSQMSRMSPGRSSEVLEGGPCNTLPLQHGECVGSQGNQLSCLLFPKYIMFLFVILISRFVNFENLPRLSQILVKRTMTKNRRKSTRHVHLFIYLVALNLLNVLFGVDGKGPGHGEVIGKVDHWYTKRGLRHAQTMSDLSTTGQLSHCVPEMKQTQNLIDLDDNLIHPKFNMELKKGLGGLSSFRSGPRVWRPRLPWIKTCRRWAVLWIDGPFSSLITLR